MNSNVQSQGQEKSKISTPSDPKDPKFQYHKQKLHPFDFTGEDLAEIKQIFPEFRPKRAVTRTSSKVAGLPIADLKKKLKEKIKLEGKPLIRLVQKLDHKNEEKITWSEFLTFLENEGMKREIVNDAQLYGIGVKRLVEGVKTILKEDDRVAEYYIDSLVYIQLKSFSFVLTLFENNAAKLMEYGTFKVVQELQFSSDYAQPKNINPQTKKGKSHEGRTSTAIAAKQDKHLNSQTEGFQKRNRTFKYTFEVLNNQQTRSVNFRKQDEINRSLSNIIRPNSSIQKRPNTALKSMDQRREQLMNKSKRKMFGVLGLTKIEDEAGSGAYYLGKDATRERPFGLKDLFPNLHQDYDSNKRKFDQLMVSVDKQIKVNENSLSVKDQSNSKVHLGNLKMGRMGSLKKSIDDIDQQSAYMNISRNPKIRNDTSTEQLRLQQIELNAKANHVINRIKDVKGKVDDQHEKLDDLRETNKYFYRLTSQSPYVMAQEDVIKKGNYKTAQKDNAYRESNQCNPQMISKYVEKMTKQRANSNQKNDYIYQQEKQSLSENFFEQNRKNKIKHTKEVYSVCAYYHQEMSTLAISLIDKEIKIYKAKQNGSKVNLVEQYSFNVKIMVSSMHIEQYVVNSRLLLCLGSQIGEIALYYLDEPTSAVNALQQQEQSKFRSQLHSTFNFFQKPMSPRVAPVNKQSILRAQDTINEDKNDAVSGIFDSQINFNESNFDEEAQKNLNTEAPLTYLAPQQVENELTCIKYIRDIGLIATSLNGLIKIFDAFDFKEVWKSSNKTRKQQYHTNITTFDISTPMGLMATGGVEGKLMLVDPYALGIINSVTAHQAELLNVYFYDEQQHIYTVSSDRTIAIWDAFRLEKIQYIKDASSTHTPKFTSSSFDKTKGLLFVGCQALKVWHAKVDSKVEIKALQVETLSKTILKERKMANLASDPGRNSVGRGDSKTGKVLVTNTSELVDIIINEKDDMHFLITVDSENLLRAWSIKSSSTSFSYKIPMKKRVTAAAIDPTCQYLAVGNCIGEVLILNLKSGGILYKLPHTDSEITCLQYLSGMSEFQLIGGCWQGKVMMWTSPSEDNNFNITAKCRIGHKDDVLTIDSSHQYIVSGGTDGLVSIWNLFSGTLKYALALPPPSSNKSDHQELNINTADKNEEFSDSDLETDKPQETKTTVLSKATANIQPDTNKNVVVAEGATAQNLKKNVVSLTFHPYYTNLVCILQEGGDIHIIDASNGTIPYEYVAKVKLNSNWACDKEYQRLFVVGDVGRACLFDMSILTPQLNKALNKKIDSNSTLGVLSISPIKNEIERLKKKQVKWKMIIPWFEAHKIHKTESAYIVSVKYAQAVKIYITGSNKGEVKLWSQLKCEPLGTLNAASWNPTKILGVIDEVHREERQKEIKRDEAKMEEKQRRQQYWNKNKVGVDNN